MVALGSAVQHRVDIDDDAAMAAAATVYYRERLAEPAVRPWTDDHPLKPITLGPTWQIGRDGKWVLPELSLGWEVLGFLSTHLNPAAIGRRDRYEFTLEQARIILWWYAVEPDCTWVHRDGAIQRVKGHGKDPLIAAIATNVLVGPDEPVEVDERRGLVHGEQAGNPLVHLAAVAQEQTKTTMLLFPALLTDEFRHKFGIMPPGKTQLDARGGVAHLDALTSNPAKLEGFRARLALANEALALDTPIPTPSGWTTMGELQTGDEVYASDGTATTVTAMPVQHDRKCYRVTFADGSSIVASDGHLWETSRQGQVTTTENIARLGGRWGVPLPTGARQTPFVDLPLDPYVLGVWLGDGSKGQAYISAADSDAEAMAEQLRARGAEVRVDYQPARAARLALSRRTADSGGDMGTPTAKALRSLPCYRDKHVPRVYLDAGTEQRLELLRGLMDTDGCASLDRVGRVRCIFIGTTALADAVVELAQSLGQLVRRSWTVDDRSRQGGYWRVEWVARLGVVPFSLPRKAEKFGKDSAQVNMPIVSVVEVPSVPVRCIAVEHERRLFQAGPSGVLTHNTHHWKEANGGLEMDAVLRRNMRKNADARVLRTTNAFAPGEESVAERDRKAYEDGNLKRFFYDTVEAPREAELTRAHGEQVVPMVRGDSTWLTVDMFVEALEDERDAESVKRRFWYNQVQANEESWLDPRLWDDIGPAPEEELLVLPDERIVLFGDGSKSDDATALMGCRVSDGHVFFVGVWARPPGLRPAERAAWRVDRDDVDRVVAATFSAYKVVGFWFDPSDVLDDEDGSSYWTPYCDIWHTRYGERMPLKPTGPGGQKHSVIWDMRSDLHTKEFTEAAMQFVNDVDRGDFTQDGQPLVRRHVGNARKRPGKYGVSLQKESRESPKKIDLAVCAVGARMMRRLVVTGGKKMAQRSGRVV